MKCKLCGGYLELAGHLIKSAAKVMRCTSCGTCYTPMLVDVSGVDWKLLRWQKSILVKRSMGNAVGEIELEYALDGIVALIDDIQDQAAEFTGERKVFGSKSGR